VNGRAADHRLSVSQLVELASKALERAEAALRGGDPEAAWAWLTHAAVLRDVERSREVEVVAAMELGLDEAGGP